MLRWSEIEALQKMGMRIEAHTASHPDLRQLSDAAVRAECESADETIVSRLGVRPRYFAYPYGRSNARVRAFTRDRYAAASRRICACCATRRIAPRCRASMPIISVTN